MCEIAVCVCFIECSRSHPYSGPNLESNLSTLQYSVDTQSSSKGVRVAYGNGGEQRGDIAMCAFS